MVRNYSFNYQWLEQPKWSWVRPGSNSGVAKCVWCDKQIAIHHLGQFALTVHAKGKQHNAMKREISKKNIQFCPRTKSKKTKPDTLNSIVATDGEQVLNYEIEVDEPLQCLSQEIEIVDKCLVEKAEICEVTGNIRSTQTVPDTVNCVNANDGKQVLSFGTEVNDPIQYLLREIDLLQQCAGAKAELCEATGNIKFVFESNMLRRIAEKKIEKLQRLKSC